MPFTPFHMGAGLIVKPAANRNFSLLTFGLAQIAMDIEPMVGMLRDAEVLHGPSHTLIGALVIAILVAWLAPPLCNAILRRYNLEAIHHNLAWLQEPEAVSKSAVWAGAMFGTVSHVILDSLMHHDIKPLAPFSDANPLRDLMSHDGIYQLCMVLGLLGGAAWLWQKWQARSKKPSPSLHSSKWLYSIEAAFSGTLSTWLWIVAAFSIDGFALGFSLAAPLLLVFNFFFRLPVYISQYKPNRGWGGPKRAIILLCGIVATMEYCHWLDSVAEDRAAELIRAIYQFKERTGRYPHGLTELIPNYIHDLPALKPYSSSPKLQYQIEGDTPVLFFRNGPVFDRHAYEFSKGEWIDQR